MITTTATLTTAERDPAETGIDGGDEQEDDLVGLPNIFLFFFRRHFHGGDISKYFLLGSKGTPR